MSGLLRVLFGAGTWGAGGNLVAWVLCGAIAAAWLRAKLRAQAALARLHHQQKMDQASEHHEELRRELDGVRGAADRAHRIAADTHEHLTGQPHPDAPAKRRP